MKIVMREGDKFIRDDSGHLFPSFEAAELDAAEAVTAIIRDVGPRSGGYSVRIEMRDEQGTTLVATAAALQIDRIPLKA